MPIIPPLVANTPADHDARFIGMAAALKTFMNFHVADNEKMLGYVTQLVDGDDKELVAKAMYVAQWIGGR